MRERLRVGTGSAFNDCHPNQFFLSGGEDPGIQKEFAMKTLKTLAILTLAAVGFAAAQPATPAGGKKEHKVLKTHKHHHHHKKGPDAGKAK
jgi:hypothetical protein